MMRVTWALIAVNMVLACIIQALEPPGYLPEWVPIELWITFSLATASGFAVMAIRALRGQFE